MFLIYAAFFFFWEFFLHCGDKIKLGKKGVNSKKNWKNAPKFQKPQN